MKLIRGLLLATLLATAAPATAGPLPASPYPPVPPGQRQVGIAYSTWHTATPWRNVWGTPAVGFYKSDDRRVIDQHARWLADAGVDFIWVDWSNNVNYTRDPAKPNPTFDMIEGATATVFDEFAKLRAAGVRTPRISIFAGVTLAPAAAEDGRLRRKVDQIYRQYVANTRYRPLLEDYLGKPLLVVYVNTPSPWQAGVPRWTDGRFTVRWMTGYVSEQHALQADDRVSQYGYWSWEDRGPQTYPLFAGRPEAMVVTAATRADLGVPGIPAAGRENGATFQREWARARAIGPRFAMVGCRAGRQVGQLAVPRPRLPLGLPQVPGRSSHARWTSWAAAG